MAVWDFGVGCVCFVLSAFITIKLHDFFRSLKSTSSFPRNKFWYWSLMFPQQWWHFLTFNNYWELQITAAATGTLGEVQCVVGLSGNLQCLQGLSQPQPYFEEDEHFLLCLLKIRKGLCITDWRKLKISWLATSYWCWYGQSFALQRRLYCCLRKGKQLFPWHLCLRSLSMAVMAAGLDGQSFHGTTLHKFRGAEVNGDPRGRRFSL